MNIVSVESIADLIRGVTFKSEQKLHNDGDGLVPCLRTANIQSQIEYDDLWFIAKTLVKNNKQFLIPGDIIFSAANSKELVGKSAMFRGSKKSITFGAFLTVIRPKQELILPKYLCYYLNSAGALDELRRMASITTNIANISNAKVSVLPVPLPCIIDQKKIVAKIDSLFADIDAGLEKINEVKAKLDSIKQSILKQAFDGTLIGAMKEIEFQQITNLVDIRDDLRKPINSENRKKRIEGKEYFELYPYYGATGQVGFIDDYLINGEYVLVGEDGAPFLDRFRDKAYIIQGKSWVNNHAHILQAIAGRTYNKFIKYYLNYFRYDDYVNGTTRLKLTKGMLEQIPVPIFNLKDQEKIVAKIDSLFADIDNQFEKINQLEQQLNSLKQSILKQAFEGNLV